MERTGTTPLHLRAELAELDRLTAYIEEFAAEQALDDRDRDALTLAAEELFANTVEHGGEAACTVALGMEDGGGGVWLCYADDAPPFDPTQAAEPDVSLGAHERPVGGLGLLLVRRLMESVRYERSEGRNRMTLIRRLRSPAQGAEK